MKNKLLYSTLFVAVGILCLSCAAKKQSDENLALEPVAEMEIDTVAPAVEILVDVSGEGHVEKIYDTVINGVKFRDFYFKCEGEGEVTSDETVSLSFAKILIIKLLCNKILKNVPSAQNSFC